MQNKLRLSLLLFASVFTMSVLSAEKVDLTHHKIQYLTPYFGRANTPKISALSLSVIQPVSIKRQKVPVGSAGSALTPGKPHVDFNGTTHYRLNQTYQGYPVSLPLT